MVKGKLFIYFAISKHNAVETKHKIDINSYKLIIFDCDGTLVDSEPISNGMIGTMVRELGIDMSDKDAYYQFRGTSFAHITAYVESALGHALDIDFEGTFRTRVQKAFEKDLKPMEGVVSFIKKLKAKICVASNGPQIKMATTLPITGLDKYFDEKNMFSAYDIQKWKPEPDLFLFAAEQMGYSPSECLVIEDTFVGAMGAVNAHMDVLVLPDDKDIVALRENNIATFKSFQELEASLK